MAYNTKITVNRNLTKAIAVVNNAVAPAGADRFVVHGSGLTLINASTTNLTDDVFIIRDALDPNPATYDKFKVKRNGEVYARYIKVTVNAFPDYVFANNYKLKSLKEVEAYIKTNKHLPNIPSASEIEANGLDVAEMSKLQMEKIEELTLYVIELKKELDALKKEVKNK